MMLPALLRTLIWALALCSLASAQLDQPALPFQLPHYAQQGVSSPSILTRLRDSAIKAIWGPPPKSCQGGRAARIRKPGAEKVIARYGGDVVLRFNISTAEEARALAETTNTLFLDVWEFNSDWADIRVSKEVVPSLLGLLPKSLQKAHTPLMHDLAQAIYDSYPSPKVPNPSPHPTDRHGSFSPRLNTPPDATNIFFRDYQPLSVIHPWMRLLQSLFPTHVRLVNLGTTYEGRDILGLRVGVKPKNSDKPSGSRKTIVVSGGSHAREWISTAGVNYGAYSLITSYGKSREMTKLMEEFDWVFIPTLNPDGYIYTWESDRLWRKNRQETNLRFCKGVDLDRSYSYQWDGESTKGNPCSESFAGDAPFDGVEASRFANWVKNETEYNNASFVGFLDFHSYSQQVLYPFSFSCIQTPPTLENLEELGMGLAKAIKQADSKNYAVTSACEGSVTANKKSKKQSKLWPRIESGGGSALDYMYHEMHVKYAYQVKLRDRGSYGFLLPSKNIVPTGKEVFNAISYFGRYLLGNKGIETMDDSPSTDGFVVFKKMEDSEADAPESRTNEDGAAEEDHSGLELR